MEKMNSLDGKTYIKTLTKVLFRNRSLLSFLFIFSSDFVFDSFFYLIYSSYIVEFILRFDQTEDEDYEHKEVKNILTDMEHKIHSDLESFRKECGEIREEVTRVIDMDYLANFDVNWNVLRNDLISKVNKEVKASMQELNKDLKCLTENLHETIQETTKEAKAIVAEDIKASRATFNKDVKFFTDQLHETCVVIEKTAKEVKIAGEIYLNVQIDHSKRVMIRGENLEKVSELREKVRRLSLEAEIVAEELSRETANLVEAMTQQWEEDTADYLASLPLLDHNH